MKQGTSLIEIMVAITVFAVIGVLSTRSIFLTLRGSKRSDSQVRVRENVNHALSIIERQIRNSQSVDCTTSTATQLNYITPDGVSASFSYASDYIASGSARLTADDINITNCVFSCSQAVDNPAKVTINVSAEDKLNTSTEKGSITSQTEIITRNY